MEDDFGLLPAAVAQAPCLRAPGRGLETGRGGGCFSGVGGKQKPPRRFRRTEEIPRWSKSTRSPPLRHASSARCKRDALNYNSGKKKEFEFNLHVLSSATSPETSRLRRRHSGYREMPTAATELTRNRLSIKCKHTLKFHSRKIHGNEQVENRNIAPASHYCSKEWANSEAGRPT